MFEIQILAVSLSHGETNHNYFFPIKKKSALLSALCSVS